MSDPTFDAFRRRLADAVTIAINNGVRVSASDKSCCCPLGCLPESIVDRPFPSELVPLEAGEAWAFICGFELGRRSENYPEYAALGQAYRRRFP